MQRSWSTLPRLFRFFVVGGINTVFGYAAYAFLLFIGLHYVLAALFGTVAGVLFNFLTTGTLVFDGMSRTRLRRFIGVYCATYVINVALLTILVSAGLGAYVAGLVCIVPMALVSYALMRRFVFGGPSSWP
jgi:putative flippase GtrA